MERDTQNIQNNSISKFISMNIMNGQQIFDDEEFLYSQPLSLRQNNETQILLGSQAPKDQNISTINSKKEKSKVATAKYREKKKEYVKQLQQSVRVLQNQIQSTQGEIQKYKDHILNKLQTISKMNTQGHENAEIFNQLGEIINKSQQQDDIDIDKVNLLLDTLKYRIGASGKERQAKMKYYFKNIINTLFPALHRYLLYMSFKQVDLFSAQSENTIYLDWTMQLYKKLDLSSTQKQKLKSSKQKLKGVYEKSLKLIENLNNLQQMLKEEEIVVDNIEDKIRQKMTPVQCGKWTIFCEKHKYKEQIFLDKKFIETMTLDQIEREELEQQLLIRKMYGRKQVKKDIN